jgi:hypothetical protein
MILKQTKSNRVQTLFFCTRSLFLPVTAGKVKDIRDMENAFRKDLLIGITTNHENPSLSQSWDLE